MERQVIIGNLNAQKTGVWLGFFVAMTAIGGGIFLVFHGQSSSGLVAIISALTALVATFVLGRKKQKEDLRSKS